MSISGLHMHTHTYAHSYMNTYIQHVQTCYHYNDNNKDKSQQIGEDKEVPRAS